MSDMYVRLVRTTTALFRGILPLFLIAIGVFADGGGVVSANTEIIPVEPTTMMLSGPWQFADDPYSQGLGVQSQWLVGGGF